MINYLLWKIAIKLSSKQKLKSKVARGHWVWSGDWLIHKESPDLFVVLYKDGTQQMKCRSLKEVMERFGKPTQK